MDFPFCVDLIKYKNENAFYSTRRYEKEEFII